MNVFLPLTSTSSDAQPGVLSLADTITARDAGLLDALRARGIFPAIAGGAEDDTDGDTGGSDDHADDDHADDTDPGGGDHDDDAADDDDDDADDAKRELAEARRKAEVAEAARRKAEAEAKRLRKRVERRTREEQEDQGEWKSIAETEKARADAAEAKLRQNNLRLAVQNAATNAGARRPEHIMQLLDLPDDVVDDDGEVDTRTVERAINTLKRSADSRYLFKGDQQQAAELNGDRTGGGARKGRRPAVDTDLRGATRIEDAYANANPR